MTMTMTMTMTRPPGLFVVGTDTGVGKTRVAASIARSMAARGRRVGVLKPLATGAERVGGSWKCEDAEALIAARGGDVDLDRVVPFCFEEPLAPAVAARRLGAPLGARAVLEAVGRALAWWSDDERAEVMVVEGVGGLLTPLADDLTVAGLASALDYPLVIVARRALGTLNHTLMTLECARLRGLRVAGVILNAADAAPPTVADETNAGELARLIGPAPVLAEVPYLADPAALSIELDDIDWYARSERDRSGWPHAGGGGKQPEETRR